MKEATVKTYSITISRNVIELLDKDSYRPHAALPHTVYPIHSVAHVQCACSAALADATSLFDPRVKVLDVREKLHGSVSEMMVPR